MKLVTASPKNTLEHPRSLPIDQPYGTTCRLIREADDEYLSKITGVCNVSPFMFFILFGYALERQSSLGEVIPGGNPTGMSYL